MDARTEVYGVLGHPVGHSLSPLMHNAVFRRLKLNAIYLAFDVEQAALGLALESLRALGVKGVNLTIPLKEAAVGFVDEIPEDIDRCAGAINTVVNKDGKLFGYNTDGPGFLLSLAQELRWKPEGKTVLIVGAGGGARGVAFALAKHGAEKILILNRTKHRAAGLRELLETHFPETEIGTPGTLDEISAEKIHLVVNATSCGMNADAGLAVDLRRLEKAEAVMDLVYTSPETPLLKMAKGLGLPHVNGLGMLAAQAAMAFELWTGKTQAVRETMLEELKTCPC